jgi:hypothetical protein
MASIVLLLSILCACSAARLAFNNGETVSYFWLDRYVDFDADQKPWVKKEIAALFSWHRQTQLKDYVQLLNHVRKQVESPVTEADIARDEQEVRKRVQGMLERAAPSMAELALSLQPRQIAHIEQRFAENNDKFKKENLHGDVATQQQERYRKTLKQAEHWFGSLSREQEREIRMLSEARPLNNELVLADRMERQGEILRLLGRIESEKPSREAATALIRQHLARMMNHEGNPERKAWFEQYRVASIHMMANIINNTTAEQKRHFVQELQGWIDDFQRLQQPATPGPSSVQRLE